MCFWDARRRRRNRHPKAPGASPEILLVLLHCPATVPLCQVWLCALLTHARDLLPLGQKPTQRAARSNGTWRVSLAPTYEYKCADNAVISKRLKRKSCAAWPCPEMTCRHLLIRSRVLDMRTVAQVAKAKVIDQLPPVAGRFHRIDESASLATFDAFQERDERLVGAKRLCT